VEGTPCLGEGTPFPGDPWVDRIEPGRSFDRKLPAVKEAGKKAPRSGMTLASWTCIRFTVTSELKAVTRSLSKFRFLTRVLGCVVVTLSASACVDDLSSPLAVAVAPETHGAILMSDGPVTVPQLLSRYGLDQDGAAQAEAWWDSWSMEAEEGASLRSKVYPLAAASLFPAMGSAGVEDLLGRNALTLTAAEGIASLIGLQAGPESLKRARRLQTEARTALRDGQVRRSLELAMEVSDALWTVSPNRVAAELLAQAQAAMGRNQADGTHSKEELIRIRRLIHGASEALEAGDYPGAIRRAYYACQLLGGSPP